MAKYEHDFKKEIAELVPNKIKRISKIMREYGIKVNGVKKFKASSASSKPTQNIKENLLKQNFKTKRKN